METIVNLGTNPSAEAGTTNWNTQALRVEQSAEWAASGTKSFRLYDGSTTSSDIRRGSAGSYAFDMKPGRTYTVSAVMRLAAPMEAVHNGRQRRLSILYSTNNTSYTFSYGTQGPNVAGVFTSVATATIPENATGILIMLGLGSSIKADEVWWDAISIVEGSAPVDYFDGDTGRVAIPGSVDWYTHRWLGTPGLSVSIRERMSVSAWTRRWWELLPSSYKDLDASQNAEINGYPLLRFMDGPGRIAGGIRDLSDLMWSGAFTAPATVPDYAIRWLAQLLGVPREQRELPVDTLRAYLVDLVTQGRPAAGNRQSIVLAAKRFLTGERQTIVQPSATAAHTILVLVRADEVPGHNVAVIADGIRSAGVIPAGHDLQVILANATWDAWEASSGEAWDELESLAPTWAKADSLGIELE